MAHSARFIILCIVATLLMTNAQTPTPTPTPTTTNATTTVAATNATTTVAATNATTTVVATNATTTTPVTTPNATTTVAPNTTAAPVANGTTAAPNATTRAPNATNATTVAPVTTAPATPPPTTAPPSVSMTVDGNINTFNQTDFFTKAAAAVNLTLANVDIQAVRAGSVFVQFGFKNLANADAATAAANNFVTAVATGRATALTSAYTVTRAPTLVVHTPAPINAGVAHTVIAALIAAVLLIVV